MMLALIPLLFLASGASAVLTDGCNAFVECMGGAQERVDECSQILEDADLEDFKTELDDRQTCLELVKGNVTLKSALSRDKDAAFSACLERRSRSARNIEDLGPNKKRACERSLENYGKKLDRVKRNANRRQRQDRRRQLKQSGKWNEWQALKEKKREFRVCQRDARKLTQSCKPLAQCCSEASVCHLEYELSPTHDGIKQAQLNIILTRRECEGLKPDDLDVVSADQIVDNQI